INIVSPSDIEFGKTGITPAPFAAPTDSKSRRCPNIRIPFFVVLLLFILVSNITVGIVTYHLTRQSGQQTSQMLITMLQEKYVDIVQNVLTNRLNHTEVAAIEIRELWEDGAFIRRPWQQEEIRTMWSILKAQSLFLSSMHFTTLDGNLFGWAAIENLLDIEAKSSDPDIITANAYTLWKMEENIYYEEHYDVDGNLLWTEEPYPEYDASLEPWVQVLVQNNASRQWTRPYGEWFTHATRAINRTTGETIVYTGADLSIPFIGRTLKQYAQNQTAGYDIHVYVIDTTDKFVLGSSDTTFQSLIFDETGWPVRPVFLDEIANNNTFVRLINTTLTNKPELWESDQMQTLKQQSGSRQLFITFKRIRLDPKNTWLIVQVADGTDIIKLVDSNFDSSIITLCVVLVGICVIGFLFSLSIGRTIVGLVSDLKKLAKFDFAGVEYLKSDRRRFHFIAEIAMVQQAFLATVKEFSHHLQLKRILGVTAVTTVRSKAFVASDEHDQESSLESSERVRRESTSDS
ncbi:hypothetical protein HK102_005282, partial [Quaeritorhiza haematococci]